MQIIDQNHFRPCHRHITQTNPPTRISVPFPVFSRANIAAKRANQDPIYALSGIWVIVASKIPIKFWLVL